MIRKGRYTYTPVCDGCCKELEPEYDYMLAVCAMKSAGWAIIRPERLSPEWHNLCPECKGMVGVDDG